MSYYVIGEPEYEASNWYRSILEGLISEKRQRRFSLIPIETVDTLKDLNLQDEDLIFIIGTNCFMVPIVA